MTTPLEHEVIDDVDRLVGELASVKGENVQLRQRLELLGGDDAPAAFTKLEARVAKLREYAEELDEVIVDIMVLAELEPGDQGAALYYLGKIHAICERTASLEQVDGPAAEAEE